MKMRHWLRKVTVLGFGVFVVMGFGLHGCTNRLGPVWATQSAGGIGRANLANITVERSKECVEFDGHKLEEGRFEFKTKVIVNESANKVGISITGIPEGAPDIGACLRNALLDMPIPTQLLEEAVDQMKFLRRHAMESDEVFERFIDVIAGVPIVESELVLEAEGHTIVLPVTVKVQIEPEKLIDGDEKLLKAVGQAALDHVGYDEIMRQVEVVGWVETVPDEQALSTADKKFIGDVSLSPTPQPPRPPPPPSVIAKTISKRIVTRAAPPAVARVLPKAIARAAPGAGVPGTGEIIAVGIVALTLIELGILEPEDILAGGQAHGSTPTIAAAGGAVGGAVGTAAVTPIAPPTPATSTTAPVATVAKPQKYPNQTCEEDERIRLRNEKNKICNLNGGYAARCGGGKVNEDKLPLIPCSAILLSLRQRQACLAVRWLVQDKCFGGKPDPEHEGAIDEVQNGIDHCEALKLKNCAKGHPMAEK